MKNHNTSTNRIEVKESKNEMLKLCRYGYGNFKKQKTIIPSNNMILNTTVQIFRLLLTRKYVCRLVPINCDFSGPAERVRLMTCRLIGNYHDKEFTLWPICKVVTQLKRWMKMLDKSILCSTKSVMTTFLRTTSPFSRTAPFGVWAR